MPFRGRRAPGAASWRVHAVACAACGAACGGGGVLPCVLVRDRKGHCRNLYHELWAQLSLQVSTELYSEQDDQLSRLPVRLRCQLRRGRTNPQPVIACRRILQRSPPVHRARQQRDCRWWHRRDFSSMTPPLTRPHPKGRSITSIVERNIQTVCSGALPPFPPPPHHSHVLDVQTAAGCGTRVVVAQPMSCMQDLVK